MEKEMENVNEKEEYDVNHDVFLTRARWKILDDNAVTWKVFSTDSFVYEFNECLSKENQQLLLDYMEDSDHVNSLTPVDFCNFFLHYNIDFKFKYRYCKHRSLYMNFLSLRIVWSINKKLKKLKK